MSAGDDDMWLFSNTVVSGVAGRGGARYNAITWPNDQYSQCVIATLSSKDFGPVVRSASGAATFYWVTCGAGFPEIYKRVAGAYTVLSSGSGAYAGGDTLYLSAQSTTVTYKRNGAGTFTATDSAISAGFAGLFTVDGSAAMDNFEGGDLASTQDTPELRGRPGGLRGETQMRQLLAQ